jgi:hypothetical protein
MLKKTLLATATAGMIAAGALATAGSAAAAPHGPYGGPNGGFQFGGPNWTFQFNAGPRHHPKRICKPVFRQVKWWDRYGRPHWKRVAVGRKCFIVRPHHNRHHNWNGPNWDGGYNYPGPY